MSEFDDLVSRPGVIMAGRIGPDGRVAEHKSTAFYVEPPWALEMAHWFTTAATAMFAAMAAALDGVTTAGSWRPIKTWMYIGGDYALAVHGAYFVVGESAKVGSFDEIAGLLRQLDS
jgi:roadblock/LC7 domain-containing protein